MAGRTPQQHKLIARAHSHCGAAKTRAASSASGHAPTRTYLHTYVRSANRAPPPPTHPPVPLPGGHISIHPPISGARPHLVEHGVQDRQLGVGLDEVVQVNQGLRMRVQGTPRTQAAQRHVGITRGRHSKQQNVGRWSNTL